jgi:hypothetical protein
MTVIKFDGDKLAGFIAAQMVSSKNEIEHVFRPFKPYIAWKA